jgi:hypothetical protein
MEEVVADLLFGVSVRRRVIMGRELPDGEEVGHLAALAPTGELQILKHPLAENYGHVLVLSQRVKKQPLEGPSCTTPKTATARWIDGNLHDGK